MAMENRLQSLGTGPAAFSNQGGGPNDKVVGEHVSQQSLIANTQTNGPDDGEDFPDGGKEAWLCAAGTAGIMFCTLGYANSFGVFQAYYMHHQLRDHSPDDISWIGSIQVFLVFASGAVGGPIFDRFGAWVIRPAAIAYLASVMLTSVCTAYWHFVLAQGVLSGVSNGLLMFPAMAAVPQHFNRRRGAAMGLAIAGSSLGAVVFPVVLARLLLAPGAGVGFGWAVRVCGLVMVPVLVFGAATVRARLPPRASRFFLWSAFARPLYALLVAGTAALFLGMFVPLFYLPSYAAREAGMDESTALYLVAAVNGASLPGRIIPGILGDRLGRVNTLAAAGAATSVLIFCWPSATTPAGVVAFACVFGFVSGALVSGGSVVFTLCPDSPKDIGTYMGMGIAVASLAVLVGPPVSGAILERYGGFREVSILSGVSCMLGAVLCLVAKAHTLQGVRGRI
ncbi:hypothetical protein RB601_005152 [Gaeumannomyces tritici]